MIELFKNQIIGTRFLTASGAVFEIIKHVYKRNKVKSYDYSEFADIKTGQIYRQRDKISYVKIYKK